MNDKADKIKFVMNNMSWTAGYHSHVEIECLPSAGSWGYDTFPALAAYTRTLFEDRLYMTGRFQNSWGDFGGIKPNESEIEIISNLQHRELLKGNTTVVYKHDDNNKLPEHYNGLGYMNLICMIFEIEILIQEFKREKERTPADINLLFIEEPEAHTHPQMQYVFIKNH